MEDLHSETESYAAARITELKRFIQERDRTIIKLMKRADRLTRLEEDEDVDEVEKEVRSLKMGQENVKNLLKGLTKESDLGIDVLLKRIKEIEEEEYDLNSRLNGLMRNINGEDDVIQEEESVEEIKKGVMELLGVKIARLLEFVCCCFMTGESKKQRDSVSVNEEVEVIKKGAIIVGVKISGLLVDAMVLLSQKNELQRKEFQEFRISLERDSGEDAPAINKFVALIGIEEGMLRNMEIPDLSESSSTAEISDSDGLKITKILDALRPEILNLNLIMMDSSKSDLTERDVSSMKNDLKECMKNWKILKKEVKKLWVWPSISFFAQMDALEGKINEIWKGESEEEKE